MIYCRYILVISFLFPIVIFGKPIIINQGTGKPINQVAIYNLRQDISVFSDRKGEFDHSQFNDNDTLFFQHPSYNPITLTTKQTRSLKHLPLIKKNIQLEEFIISANKRKEKRAEVAQSMDVIESDQLILSPHTNSADVLISTGNIAIQKSQGGGGSPILRGFEANKILLVVDGIRMNNAIYRSGHIQNSLTIDSEILERIEVVFGPGSVIYGSDALGGVIHYKTLDPEFAMNEKINFNAAAKYQISAPTNNEIKHFHFNAGLKKLSILTSFTQKNLGDMVMGNNRNPLFKNYGKLYHYPARINDTDSSLTNQDPNTQVGTGYSQTDFVQKLRLRAFHYHDITLNFQYSTSSDIPRYEKLSKYASENRIKYAEWYYGPQNRILSAIDYRYTQPNLLFNDAQLVLSYQKIDESRYKRNLYSSTKKVQQESVEVYSANLDFYKKTGENSHLVYGAEFYHNTVISSAYKYDIFSLQNNTYTTRYPDGKNFISSYSAFANYKISINEQLILSAGLRYNNYTLQIAYDSIAPYNFINFSQSKTNNQALTGSLSLIYSNSPLWRFNTLLSSGFRNPNIDDVGKIRDQGSDLIIPNSNVNPEYAYNLEFGASRTFIGLFRMNATVFGSFLTDAIVRTSYSYNNIDSVIFDNEIYNLQINKNANQALIYGVSASLESDFNDIISFNSTINYTLGQNITDNVPLGHIPPIYGKTNVRLHYKKYTQELSCIYNGWKHLNDFSPEGEDKDDEALNDYGFPSWAIVNYNINYLLGKNINLQFSIENILDQFYKPYASAVAGMGRTFTVSIRVGI
ncbi:TonB-dependent receptor [Bacteroidales bacterium]|nr:TonB-dependent receptor [Bacteroidales bacterium]